MKLQNLNIGTKAVALTTLVVGVIFSNAAVAVTADKFTCSKQSGTNLVDFKANLVESCDLTKPFSTSLSRLLNEETYLFCCHKKTTAEK